MTYETTDTVRSQNLQRARTLCFLSEALFKLLPLSLKFLGCFCAVVTIAFLQLLKLCDLSPSVDVFSLPHQQVVRCCCRTTGRLIGAQCKQMLCHASHSRVYTIKILKKDFSLINPHLNPSL